MRIKILMVFLYFWIVGNSSFSSSAHLQESKKDDEVQKKPSNFESAGYGSSYQIKSGQGGSGHGGNGGSHGGSTGGGSSSSGGQGGGVVPHNAGGSSSSGGQQSAGVIPHNAGGSAQELRNNQHRGGSSYNRNAGYLTIVAILLVILFNTPCD